MYSKIFWWDLFYDFNIFIYERIYFLFCTTFFFFKKKFSYYLVEVKQFTHVYIQVYNNIYMFNVSALQKDFSSMRFSTLYWLFFIFFHNMLLEEKKNFECLHSYHLWCFFIKCTCADNVFFGFRAASIVTGFWPKYIFTPAKLFDKILLNPIFYKNPQYAYTVRPTKFYFRFEYLFITKKKKQNNFFKNKKEKIKGIVLFAVNNLAKLFYNIKKQRHLIYFIRKQKSFNKGRYSRNRQIYRTGTYWCFYVNIVAVLGLNFLFYKFTINFLQYWWFFFGCLFICVLVYFCRSSFQTYIALCCSIIEYMSKGDLVYFLIEWLPFETFESLRNSPMYPLMDFEDTIIDSWLDYI